LLEKGLAKLGLKSRYPVFDRAVKEHRPAVLNSHFGDLGWNNLALTRRYGLRHVVTFYGYDVNMLPLQAPVWRKRYMTLFAEADLILCEGPHMATCLIDLGCHPDKVQVQRLGADLDRIPFKVRTLGDDGLVKILISGTFREKKGIPYALEAIGLIKDRYPNLRVTIIGGTTGQAREEIEKKKILEVINRYKLEQITRMVGFQPFDVFLEHAYRHHIFLSPSVTAADGDTEGGSPVTITEISATGMPVISTLHCDIPEIVKDGTTGLLVPERNVKALAEALESCLSKEYTWEVYGRNARKHVEENFNVKKLIPELEEKYRKLL
jgi:colanic acid/amylovoran biosynthesis glycosyltransferase